MFTRHYPKLWKRTFIIFTLGVFFVPIALAYFAPGNPELFPDPNDHTVPRDSYVSVTYDEDIDPTTVDASTFVVQAMQTGPITETLSVLGGEIRLDPEAPFKPGELVNVTATTGTLGLISGEGPVAPTVWQFWAEVEGGRGIMEPHPTTPSFGTGDGNDIGSGDIDGDGDIDLIITHDHNEPHTVWLNDGIGNFTPHPITPSFGGSTGQHVRLGDIDNDGDLDALVANRSSSPNTVWVNDGAGNFSPHPTQPAFGHESSTDLMLGDLDGDGDLDVIVANNGGAPESVWLNDGSGEFSAHPTTPTFGNHWSFGIDLGDLDMDGDLDAVVVNRNNELDKVYLNDGKGNFSPHPTTPSFGPGDSVGLDLGDIDNDGDLDVVVTKLSPNPTSIWVNDGTGNLSPHPTTPSLGIQEQGQVEFGDLNNDGALDMIIGVDDMNPNPVYLNDGFGNFLPYPEQPTIGDGIATGIVMEDFDGDGDLDVVFSQWTGEPNTVWLNKDAVFETFLPIVRTPFPLGIYGGVTYNGVPAANVALDLRFYDGSAWSTQASTTTDATGIFKFLYMPDLLPGQYYYVRYDNSSDPTRLFTWHTASLDSYHDGQDVHIGDFDLKNIEFVVPDSGAYVALPRNFVWQKRVHSPTDSYEFNLFDPDDGDPWFWTDPPLGYVSRYTLNALPPGFVTDTYYGWNMWVYDGLGGYGISYWFYWIAFSNTGSQPLQGPSAQLPRGEAVELDLPLPFMQPFPNNPQE